MAAPLPVPATPLLENRSYTTGENNSHKGRTSAVRRTSRDLSSSSHLAGVDWVSVQPLGQLSGPGARGVVHGGGAAVLLGRLLDGPLVPRQAGRGTLAAGGETAAGPAASRVQGPRRRGQVKLGRQRHPALGQQRLQAERHAGDLQASAAAAYPGSPAPAVAQVQAVLWAER